MIKYKINILEELANAGYNTSRLRKENCSPRARSKGSGMVVC